MSRRMLVPPLLVFHLATPSVPAPSDPAALIEAERAFARDAAEMGTRASFLAHMGDGSVVFEPLPVDARTVWEEREARPGVLSWQPEHAEISASGDMGWTTGPWEFRPRSGADEPVAFGEYATVWRKTAGGAWKWAADIGIGHDRPAGAPAEPTLAPIGGPAAATTPADVLAAERAFVAAAAAGIEAAYREHGAGGLLLLREGSARAEGVDAAAQLADRHPVSWEPMEAFVSEAGDLGWVYGLALPGGEQDSAGYLRVWRRLSDGGWKIALDVANDSPR